MIEWFGASFLVFGFILVVKALRLIPASTRTLEVVAESLSVMGDRRLDDAARESAMRRLSSRITLRVGQLILGIGAAVVLPGAIIWLLGQAGWVDFDAVMTVALSPGFIVASSAVLILALVFMPKSAASKESGSYSLGEQLLHKVAFATTSLQQSLSRLEDRIWRKKLTAVSVERPVFITALPRAGTTLLLEICARVDEFATHRYRDMPFLITPLFWSRLSAGFQKRGEKRERAHADGMLIDFDSPEALEEVIWLANFRRPYEKHRIQPFRPLPRDEGFGHRLAQHLRKVVFLRAGNRAAECRYVSKNNLNISRLTMLRGLFPKCVIVVPFRDPIQHCLSLLKQHQRFSKLHEQDAFASEYMRQIGHFDFGENLAPIDFDGWLETSKHKDPQQVGFWLEYWVACYQYLLKNHGDHVNFVDYDELCAQPQQVAQRLGAVLGLSQPGSFEEAAQKVAEAAGGIRAMRVHELPNQEQYEELVGEAYALLQRLRIKAGEAVDEDAAAALGAQTAALREKDPVPAPATVRAGGMERWLPVTLGALLLVFAGFSLGYYSVRRGTFLFRITHKVLTGAEQAYDLVTDDGLPHDFIQARPGTDDGVVVGANLDDDRLILLSSFYNHKNEVRLIRRDGTPLVRWPLSWFEIFGDAEIYGVRPESEWHVDLHGMRIHPDGDLVFTFEHFGMVRLSRCGELRWKLVHPTHHSVEFATGGGYWVLGREELKPDDRTVWPYSGPLHNDLVMRVDENGKIVRRFAISQVIHDSGLGALFSANGLWMLSPPRREEAVHSNRVTELKPEMAAAFPQFQAGDLLISLRNMNMLMVVDPQTERVKWHQIGPFLRQHDPNFTVDGKITVFSNNRFRWQSGVEPEPTEGSRVLRIDPQTGVTEIVYGGRPDQFFWSVIRGKAQPFADGGLLITEFEGGRLIEVDAHANKVWEYVNRYNKDYVAEITEGRRYDADFFHVSDWSCPN